MPDTEPLSAQEIAHVAAHGFLPDRPHPASCDWGEVIAQRDEATDRLIATLDAARAHVRELAEALEWALNRIQLVELNFARRGGHEQYIEEKELRALLARIREHTPLERASADISDLIGGYGVTLSILEMVARGDFGTVNDNQMLLAEIENRRAWLARIREHTPEVRDRS